jgi:choice-of-anchor B domain-containing protein
MKKLILFICIGLPLWVSAQENVAFISRLGYDVRSSDIWGWESPEGRKYALVGLLNGTSIVDVTEPEFPVEVVFIEGPESIWRDIKTWNDHAYVVNETAEGVLAIDLSDLPAFPDTASYTENELQTAHNIFIDENGIAYIVGANILGGGAVFLDLTIDPLAPVFLGAYEEQYIHDCYARGDTLWAGEIYIGSFSVVDVSDKANPVVLARQETPSAFTHNAWLSGDGKTTFTTDEVAGAYVTAYDVSDLSDIRELDRYRSSPGAAVIPHNTFWIDSFVVTSYYRDGVTIVDAHRPSNLIETGSYDSSPFPSGDGFNGAWGVYPYFTDGMMIVSDIEEGLFVLDPTYTRACYLEGSVIDDAAGLPVAGATVEVLSTENAVFTSISGKYATGASSPGLYDIRVSKPGCVTAIIPGVEMETAVVNEFDINLTCTAVVDISHPQDELLFEVAPSPFSETFLVNFSFPSAQSVQMVISDISGRRIEVLSLPSGKGSIECGRDLMPGIYFLECVENGERLLTYRVLKY